MKKQDLKEDMRVELRNGVKSYIRDGYIDIGDNCREPLRNWKDNLKHNFFKGAKIIKVWQPEELIWEREEVPESLKGYGKDDFSEKRIYSPRLIPINDWRCAACGTREHSKSFYEYKNGEVYKGICSDCYDKFPETSGTKFPVNPVNRYRVRLLKKLREKHQAGPKHNSMFVETMKEIKEMIKEVRDE